MLLEQNDVMVQLEERGRQSTGQGPADERSIRELVIPNFPSDYITFRFVMGALPAKMDAAKKKQMQQDLVDEMLDHGDIIFVPVCQFADNESLKGSGLWLPVAGQRSSIDYTGNAIRRRRPGSRTASSVAECGQMRHMDPHNPAGSILQIADRDEEIG